MGLASVIYNGVQASPIFHSLLLRLSTSSQLPQLTTPHFCNSHNLTFYSVSHNRRGRYSAVACAKGTEQEDDLSTSDNLQKKIEGHETYTSSIKTVAFWVCSAVVFGLGVGFKEGVGKASEFFAGYILEQSLSVDNLFVFVLIFKYFKVPVMYQNRVLSYGIAGAVIFRLALILLGTATLQRFEAVNLLFAGILLYSSVKLFSGEDDDTDLSENYIVKTCQRFIPVTTYYDGNRFFTTQDGMRKATNVLGRQLHCF